MQYVKVKSIYSMWNLQNVAFLRDFRTLICNNKVYSTGRRRDTVSCSPVDCYLQVSCSGHQYPQLTFPSTHHNTALSWTAQTVTRGENCVLLEASSNFVSFWNISLFNYLPYKFTSSVWTRKMIEITEGEIFLNF